MKLARLSLIPFALSLGCVSVRDFKPVENKTGLYRAENALARVNLVEPEDVLRESDRRLITTEANARRVLDQAPNVAALIDSSRANKCSVKTLYAAKAEQFRAEALLGEQKYAAALDALHAADKICNDVHLISAQDYLKATALIGLGRAAEARAAATRFLDYAAAITPARYREYEGPKPADIARDFDKDAERLIHYRARARDFLAGHSKLTWDEPVREPKFYFNDAYRPGGNRLSELLLLPAFGFGENYGSTYGIIGYYSFGRQSVAASFFSTSETGSYQDVRARHSVYESPNRNLDVDVFLGGRTVKRILITKTQDGEFGTIDRKVRVDKESFDPYVGAGATYRFKPQYGVSAQLTATANQLRNRVDVGHSLYGYYDLYDFVALNAGYISSRPMASVSVGFLHLGYNFRDDSVEMLLQNLLF